jgi:hypothetical protein
VVELIKEGERKGVWDFKKEATPIAATPAVAEPVRAEVKQEELKSVVTVAELKATVEQPPEKKVVSAEPKVVEATKARPLFGQSKLKEDSFIYKETNEKSQRTWQFKKGTVVEVTAPGSEGWVRITNSEKQSGWIREEQLDKQ